MSELCAARLIEELIVLSRKTSLGGFDAAVTEARRRLAAEVRNAKLLALGDLFDRQIVTLGDRNTPTVFVDMLLRQRGEVISKASEMTFGDRRIPFLPVIPLTCRSPYDLMSTVYFDGRKGHTQMSPVTLIDSSDTSHEPCYIYDVEDGLVTLGASPEQAENIFESQERHGHTVAEDIALATHTNVLERHSLLSTGSRCRNVFNGVLTVGLEDGRPELCFTNLEISNPKSGSASYGTR